jgi:hypothetical protein
VTVCVEECYWSEGPNVNSYWTAIRQAHNELPENGASDAPKHVGVR